MSATRNAPGAYKGELDLLGHLSCSPLSSKFSGPPAAVSAAEPCPGRPAGGMVIRSAACLLRAVVRVQPAAPLPAFSSFAYASSSFFSPTPPANITVTCASSPRPVALMTTPVPNFG